MTNTLQDFRKVYLDIKLSFTLHYDTTYLQSFHYSCIKPLFFMYQYTAQHRQFCYLVQNLLMITQYFTQWLHTHTISWLSYRTTILLAVFPI